MKNFIAKSDQSCCIHAWNYIILQNHFRNQQTSLCKVTNTKSTSPQPHKARVMTNGLMHSDHILVFYKSLTCNTTVVIKLSELLASILETQGGDETETTLIASGEIPRSSWAVCLSIIASIEAVEPPKECPTSRSSYPCHHIFTEPQSFYNLKEDMLL
jgi:hypothetical protein